MEAIKSLLSDFDLSAILPDLPKLLGGLELLLRVAVLIGPLCLLGLGLTIAMALRVNGYRDLEYEAAIWSAIEALGLELVLILASIVAVNIAVFVAFDRKGYRRRRKRR